MRGVVPLAIVVLVLAGCANSNGLSNQPIVTVAGLVSNAMSQPVTNTNVDVRTYPANSCGGTQLIQVTAKTNNSGVYRAELAALAGTFTACIRVTVGATVRDTTVTGLPQFSTVQVNLSVP